MVASKNENRISKTLLLPLWKPVKNVSFATSKLKKLINWTKTFLIEIIFFYNRNNFVKEKKHAQDVDKKCIEMELIALSSEFL